MTQEEREKTRHEEYIKKLECASTVDELPAKVNNSTILNYLTKLVSTSDYEVDKTELKDSLEYLLEGMSNIYSDVFINKIIDVLSENYPNKSTEEVKKQAISIARNKRLYNLVSESILRTIKFNDLYYKDCLNQHELNIRKINSTMELDQLPRIGLGSINAQIAKELYDYFKKEKLKVEYTGQISKNLLAGKSFDSPEIHDALYKLCSEKPMINYYNDMSIEDKIEYLTSILSSSYELLFLVSEVQAKEKRILKIYSLEHDYIMDMIKDATRIRELPSNLSISKITNYLSSNSMVYPKGENIPANEFLGVSSLLLEGKSIKDEEIKTMIKDITKKYYEEKKDEAFSILYGKLVKLPRLDYYVEEVRECMSRQSEFIKRGSSNVNVYMIPNNHSPLDGGKFYNIYISSAVNLSLEEILPINLDEIVPPNMDIDAIEWYVRNHEKGDKSFKAAGGIILNKDESIGSVNIFKPADGKLGITPEEKTRYEKIEDLSRRLKEITKKSKEAKEAFLESQKSLDDEISAIENAMTLLLKPEDNK